MRIETWARGLAAAVRRQDHVQVARAAFRERRWRFLAWTVLVDAPACAARDAASGVAGLADAAAVALAKRAPSGFDAWSCELLEAGEDLADGEADQQGPDLARLLTFQITIAVPSMGTANVVVTVRPKSWRAITVPLGGGRQLLVGVEDVTVEWVSISQPHHGGPELVGRIPAERLEAWSREPAFQRTVAELLMAGERAIPTAVEV